MLSSLRARTGDRSEAGFVDKHGTFIFDGTPSQFHEWEFRTRAKYAGLVAAGKDDDCKALGARVLEGLRDDAYLVARDFGIENLESRIPILESTGRTTRPKIIRFACFLCF